MLQLPISTRITCYYLLVVVFNRNAGINTICPILHPYLKRFLGHPPLSLPKINANDLPGCGFAIFVPVAASRSLTSQVYTPTLPCFTYSPSCGVPVVYLSPFFILSKINVYFSLNVILFFLLPTSLILILHAKPCSLRGVYTYRNEGQTRRYIMEDLETEKGWRGGQWAGG